MTFAQKLQNYADITVIIGLNIQPGQTLIIRSPIEGAPLVRLIVASAYQAGAKLVDVMWKDDAVKLARFNHAPRDSFDQFPTWHTDGMVQLVKDGGALLSIKAVDPDLLNGQDTDLITLAQRTEERYMLPILTEVMKDAINWSIVALPIPSWAAKIYSDDEPEVQMSKLWDTIFAICRIDQPDPSVAWEQHLKQLAQTRDYLNAKQYTALKYTGPGTNLTLGMPKNHCWAGGQKDTLTGIPFIPNMPTEEVFCMPHKDKTEGVVTATRPLSYAGVLIDNFSFTFEAGRVVKVMADKGEAVLRDLIDTDEGSGRLGEVALVPHSSPISQTGLMFYNTLFDENAASHFALGRAYRFSVEGGPLMSDEEFAAVGGNFSLPHVDFMMGSGAMDIDGLTEAGEAEPIMRAGEWAFES